VVDYFRCTVTRDALFRSTIPSKGELIVDGLQLDIEIVQDLAVVWAKLLGFQLGQARPGRDFYDHTFTIINSDGQEVASVSGGGASQRGTFCFTLKGQGCTTAHSGWEHRAHDFFSPMQATITRIDLARDFFKGEYTYNHAQEAYELGEFSYRSRAPSVYQHGDFHNGNSRTFQVG
jgi:phage replication initiation protein